MNKNNNAFTRTLEASSVSSRNERGFTLIELLVVIAIIGILSAIVLASISSAREGARDARRLQDMRQIQTALEMYYLNHGGYPSTVRNPSDSNFETSHDETNNEFIDGLVDDGYLPNYILDPVNTSQYHYIYYRFGAGYNDCPKSGYYLGVHEFESIDGTHPDSPGFTCPGIDFGNYSAWTTGSFD